jgi:imidazolonepropionase-like amidohydrolase
MKTEGMEILAGRIIQGNGGVLKEAYIGIKNGIIQEVSTKRLNSEYANHVDLSDKFIMPGLIDSHVHVRYGPKPDPSDLPDDYQSIRAAENMRCALRSGFTTLVDAGGIRNMTFSLRRAQRDNIFEGPRLFVCGEMITITGGRSSLPGVRLHEVDGADSTRRAVRTLLLRHDADFIKIAVTGAISAAHTGPRHPQMNLDEIMAATDEAHSCGKKVHAHCYGSKGLDNCFKAGVDVIVHGQTLTDTQNRLMVERGMILIPTLKPYIEAFAEGGDEETRNRLTETGIWTETEPNFKKALKAGVTIALGTDSGMPGVLFGDNTRELEYMATWGMTPSQAIMAGTLNAAKSVRADNWLGSIEQGKHADLLVLGKDPLEDISFIRTHLENVMLNGRFVNP